MFKYTLPGNFYVQELCLNFNSECVCMCVCVLLLSWDLAKEKKEKEPCQWNCHLMISKAINALILINL